MEILASCCDGTVDIEGFSKLIAEELATLDLAAMEAEAEAKPA